MLIQWVDCDTRFREDDVPSRLDLVFTSDKEAIKEIKYECPLGKSDHILMEINLEMETETIDEEYKRERYRYNRTNFDGIREHFEKANWNEFENEDDVQRKWEEFIKIYNEAVEIYVPKGGNSCRKGKEWYNERCERARKRKTRSWNKWMKVKTEDNWKDYITSRNECVKVMREVKHGYEKDIMQKCKSEPKLFYRHVNGKMRKKESVTSLEDEGRIYHDEQNMAEVIRDFNRSLPRKEIFISLVEIGLWR